MLSEMRLYSNQQKIYEHIGSIKTYPIADIVKLHNLLVETVETQVKKDKLM